jgi:hypothetical protein
VVLFDVDSARRFLNRARAAASASGTVEPEVETEAVVVVPTLPLHCVDETTGTGVGTAGECCFIPSVTFFIKRMNSADRCRTAGT